MSKILARLLGLIIGYGVGAFAGGGLVHLVSGNTHDKSLEAAMTGAFVTGPIGALLGLVLASMLLRSSNRH